MTIEAFLLDILKAASENYNTTVITGTEDPNFLNQHGLPNIRVIPVAIERKISLQKDARALRKLYKIFKGSSFDLVHSFTPKAGLLTMLASRLANIPVRIHTFTGQVWATKKGPSRWILKQMDRLIKTCATHIMTDGRSQAEFLVKEGIVKRGEIIILKNGSLCGVDPTRFSFRIEDRNFVRKRFGINEKDLVLLFLGRLNREKGVLDLAYAFKKIAPKHENTYLLVVGPDEENMVSKMRQICQPYEDKLLFTGLTNTPEKFLSAADILILPSYREGFNNVILEAASVGIPVIGSRIYGIKDGVFDGETGLLFEPGHIDNLAKCIEELLKNPDKRLFMGQAARQMVQSYFSRNDMIQAYLEFYHRVLYA